MAYDVVLTGGKESERTARLDELGVACVVKGVRYLGLRLSPRKTDAMWFQGETRRGPPQNVVCVEDALIVFRRRIRYIGLTLNSGWRLEQLFGALASILEEVTAGLGQLLLNTGRLEARMRSMALSGDPLWAEDSKKSCVRLASVYPGLNIRVLRRFLTLPYDAATTQAVLLPLDHLAAIPPDEKACTIIIITGIQLRSIKVTKHSRLFVQYVMRCIIANTRPQYK
ncbi:uncharacterized protein LOC143221042 [Lasioglossum baleicum]|uniref:uncharacterized protein LOC143221042 n=1 Tax=Lasioglossum baleicum TaxID=434251 RepID=UPI003FCD8447